MLSAFLIAEIQACTDAGIVTFAKLTAEVADKVAKNESFDANIVFLSNSSKPTEDKDENAENDKTNNVESVSDGESQEGQQQIEKELTLSQMLSALLTNSESKVFTESYSLEKKMVQSELYNLLSTLAPGSLPPLPTPVVICGAGGTRKAFLLKMLQEKYENGFAQPKPTTCRKPRNAQEAAAASEGCAAYDIIKRDEMLKMIEENQFLDHTETFENLYGITFDSITVV